jgi:diguanylate cyclase (GGDEF)-like protein
VALLFLDLDDFKRVNDTWGHLAGSRSLREMAELLSRKLPPGAITARYGGDEFVIILPGADTETAHEVAEAVRVAVEEMAHLSDAKDLGIDQAVRLTCSIGVANYHQHVGPFGPLERRQNALLRLADTAMYAAKAAGKNRVVVSDVED